MAAAKRSNVVREPGRDVREGQAAARFWQETIDKTVRYMRDENTWNAWRDWQAALYLARGRQWSRAFRGTDRLQYAADLVDHKVEVPFIAIHIENMVGFLSQANSRFLCTPRRETDVDAAEIQEAMLNYAWQELAFDEQYRLALRDLIPIGHCVLATGYTDREELDNMRPVSPRKGDTTNYDDYRRAGAPFLRRVNPFLFLYPRTAPDGTLGTSRWCAELMIRHIDDIEQDQNYDKLARSKMRAEATSFAAFRSQNDPGFENDNRDADERETDEDRFVLAKVWDKRFGMFRVIPLGTTGLVLAEGAWPYEYLDGFPYIKRDLIPVANEQYGVGFVHYSADMQLLSTRIRSKMAEHVKKHNAKYTTKGQVSPDAIRALEDDVHGAIIPLGQDGVIDTVDPPKISEDLYRVLQMADNDMQRLMMQDQLAAGENLPARTSAAEVRTRSQLFSARLRDIINSASGLLTDAARQTLQHLKANAVPGDVVRTVGRRGIRFAQLSPEDIRAEVDVRVSAIAREETDPATKRRQALELLQYSAQLMPSVLQVYQMQAQLAQTQGLAPPEPPMVDFNQLFRYAFKSFEDPELERAFKELGTEPPPIAGTLASRPAPIVTPPAQPAPNQDVAQSQSAANAPPAGSAAQPGGGPA